MPTTKLATTYRYGTLTYTLPRLFLVLFWVVIGSATISVGTQLPSIMLPVQLKELGVSETAGTADGAPMEKAVCFTNTSLPRPSSLWSRTPSGSPCECASPAWNTASPSRRKKPGRQQGSAANESFPHVQLITKG